MKRLEIAACSMLMIAYAVGAVILAASACDYGAYLYRALGWI